MSIHIVGDEVTYLVVVKVNQEVDYDRRKEEVRYFKKYDKPKDIISFAASMKEVESIDNILEVTINGHVTHKQLSFESGRLQLVDQQKEEV